MSSSSIKLKAKFSVLSELRDTFSNLVSTSDIKISCGKGKFSAHKILLASVSQFLCDIFGQLTDEDAVIIIPDIDSKRFESLLKIVYGVESRDVMDTDLIKLFNLMGIDIKQYVDVLPTTADTQMYELKQSVCPRLDRLLSCELYEDLMIFEDLEKILPSPSHSIPHIHTTTITDTIATAEEPDQDDPTEPPSSEESRLFEQYCTVCKRQCDSQVLMKYHNLIHSDSFKEKQNQGICVVCNKKFKKDYIYHHLREVHFLSLSSKYTCTHCGRNFARKEKYEGHLSKEHGAPMRYICNICGKQFSINSDLYKHRSQVHFARADMPCQTCGKLFKTKERLRRHQELHKENKPWKCDVCLKTFSRKDKLKAHAKSVHCNQQIDETLTVWVA